MKARVFQSFLCSECNTTMLTMFDNQKQAFYMLCPSNGITKDNDRCSQANVKLKIPETFEEVELYE